MLYKNLIRPLLFRMDPEDIHDLAYHFGRELSDNSFVMEVSEQLFSRTSPRLTQEINGVFYRNPVGLAAGFDKNAHLILLMQALGFGFTEIGSITANPSKGNPKPRMFRLAEDQGLVNRMGLNNNGAEDIIHRINKSARPGIPLGINIAKTHDPAILGGKAINDYVTSFKLAIHSADYITLNVSCPNTEEGKTFEEPESLNNLLTSIKQVPNPAHVPIYVKLSADLTESELAELVEICEKNNMDGYVAANTSSKRDYLSESGIKKSRLIGKGGLSGCPLYPKSLETVSRLATITKGIKPIIAVGGIDSAEKSLEMIRHGAWLIQLYTGLIYEGPFLPNRINRVLDDFMQSQGIRHLSDIRGSKLR